MWIKKKFISAFSTSIAVVLLFCLNDTNNSIIRWIIEHFLTNWRISVSTILSFNIFEFQTLLSNIYSRKNRIIFLFWLYPKRFQSEFAINPLNYSIWCWLKILVAFLTIFHFAFYSIVSELFSVFTRFLDVFSWIIWYFIRFRSTLF